MTRLRNHNATDDGKVDFKKKQQNLHSKLGKLKYGFISSKAVK